MPRILNNMADRFNKAKGTTGSKNYKAKSAEDVMKPILALSKNFLDIAIGQGIVIPVPAGTTAVKHLAAVRGKIVAARREGQCLAGRDYNLTTSKENDKDVVLLLRADDCDPLPKKTGGRKSNAEIAAAKAKEESEKTKVLSPAEMGLNEKGELPKDNTNPPAGSETSGFTPVSLAKEENKENAPSTKGKQRFAREPEKA